jgi:hypothetical protein
LCQVIACDVDGSQSGRYNDGGAGDSENRHRSERDRDKTEDRAVFPLR